MAATLVLALSGCGRPASGSSDAQPLVRIAVGVDAAFAPFYVAKQEGLFTKAGLNVELTQTEGGPAPTQTVIAGAAQLAGNSDATILPLMAKAPDLRAVAVFQESSKYLKVVLGKGITDPHQIKKMAVAPGLLTLSTVRYLESKGIDRASVQFVKAGPPDFPTLLSKGEVDGYVAFDPWVTRGVEAGGHVTETIGDFGVKYVQWIVADRTWLDAHTDLATKIIKVIGEASEIVTTQPQRAADATEKEVKIPADQTVKVLPEITFAVRDFTNEDLVSSREIVTFFQQEKLMDSSPDIDRAILKGWFTKNST
ncbi:ABC transporter substrate-binding protein [Pseudofrankia sp. BMG5.36]|uniref:ABC transporter substrate-binding protein n=1 Tax=Pseudofrankia sp. BMG5.36 TaxID=1834512 RepID=UPI0012FF8A84|nr:ABC transporter substrate-binding protein [Pseudofrankia sp. BMG5.36]